MIDTPTLLSAVKATQDFIGDDAAFPRRIVFANGRAVSVAVTPDGYYYLEVGWANDRTRREAEIVEGLSDAETI